MSYSLLYGLPDDDPVEAGFLASGSGWVAWGEAVLQMADCPECHTLYVAGWAMIDGIRAELEKLLAAGMGEDADGITATIREAAANPPPDADTLIVTDGTEPGDEDDEPDDDGE